MREDIHLKDALLSALDMEYKTGCCIRNDGSGSVQLSREKCVVSESLLVYTTIMMFTHFLFV